MLFKIDTLFEILIKGINSLQNENVIKEVQGTISFPSFKENLYLIPLINFTIIQPGVYYIIAKVNGIESNHSSILLIKQKRGNLFMSF